MLPQHSPPWMFLWEDVFRSSVANALKLLLLTHQLEKIECSMMEQIAWNKSSKNILQNTQTLQLFTINVKTEIIYESY